MQSSSKTDWARVKAERNMPIAYRPQDGPYDPNDARAVGDYLAAGIVRKASPRGKQKAPTKRLVSLRLSREVLDHYKSGGPGWQARIDADLKGAIKPR